MLLYVVISIALILASITGLQFFYLAYLERVKQQQRRHLADLERRCEALARRVHTAEVKLAQYLEMDAGELLEEEEEVWSEIIEDDSRR